MARYKALDALRGLTIALMILVNTPGTWSYVYPPLLHADWHGATPTDLVFPFFMFIIGSAMFFSFRKFDFVFSSEQFFKLTKRSAIIFFIGLMLNAYPFYDTFFDELRILGVLQRIALAYFLGATIVLLLNRTGVFLTSMVILLGYWALLATVGTDNAYSLQHNLVTQIDLALLGEKHLWAGKGVPFDPEGLLSTLPAVVSILFGFELTRYLTNINNKMQSVKQLLLIGGIAIVAGQFWSFWMPINKSLWTSTFVIYTAGIASLVLAFLVWLIDIKGNDKLVEPLIVYGTNPLFVYVLSGLWVSTYPLITIADKNLHQWIFQGFSSVFEITLASFLYALSHVILFWLVSKMLYQRKIFIKI
ncbi:MAG: DUF5009 domain-containing protein [Alteromonadaceae bacterium]|nr:DUF5009 domain-containing protein [Alteromonadaceae bacterium]